MLSKIQVYLMPRAKRIKLKRNLPRIKSHQIKASQSTDDWQFGPVGWRLFSAYKKPGVNFATVNLKSPSQPFLVSSRNAPPQERCVTILKTAARETTVNLGFFLFLIIKSIFLDFSLLFLDDLIIKF